MSSLLVTFDFKTFQKHKWTQFSNLLAQIWEFAMEDNRST